MALTKAKFGVISSALASGNATDGYVLTADGSGNSAWEEAAGGVAGISSSADATAITIDSSENVAIGSSTANKKFNIADSAQGGDALKLEFEAHSSSDKWAIYTYDRTNSHYANMSLGQNAIWINGADANIGIGSTSPVAPLTLDDKATFSFNVNDAVYGNNLYYDGAGNDRWERLSGNAGGAYYQTAGAHIWYRTSAGGATGDAVTPSESMRIDNSGNVGIGTSSPSQKLHVLSNAQIGNILLQGNSSNSIISAGNGQIKVSSLEFRGGGSGLDFDVNIVVTGVGIANRFKVDSPSGDTFTNDGTISSLSDERIKTDINDLTDGLDIVKQLRPVTFKYNDTTEDEEGKKEMGYADDTVRYGFIAQEVEEVAPQYVETSTRKINNEEVDDFKSMSTTRMIPMLFKAIQEQQTIIDDLKTRIETLENA